MEKARQKIPNNIKRRMLQDSAKKIAYMAKEIDAYTEMAKAPLNIKQELQHIYTLIYEASKTASKIDINNLRALLVQPETKGSCAFVQMDQQDDIALLTLFYEHYFSNKQFDLIRQENDDLLSAKLQSINNLLVADPLMISDLVQRINKFYNELMPEEIEKFSFNLLRTEKCPSILHKIKCLAILHVWLVSDNDVRKFTLEQLNGQPFNKRIEMLSMAMGFRITLNIYTSWCDTFTYENGLDDAIVLYQIDGKLGMLINKTQYGSPFDLIIQIQDVYELATYFQLGDQTCAGRLELKYLTSNQSIEEYYRDLQEQLDNPKKINVGVHIIEGMPIKVMMHRVSISN